MESSAQDTPLAFLQDPGTICIKRTRPSKVPQGTAGAALQGAGKPCECTHQVLWLFAEPQEGTAVYTLRWNVL